MTRYGRFKILQHTLAPKCQVSLLVKCLGLWMLPYRDPYHNLVSMQATISQFESELAVWRVIWKLKNLKLRRPTPNLNSVSLKMRSWRKILSQRRKLGLMRRLHWWLGPRRQKQLWQRQQLSYLTWNGRYPKWSQPSSVSYYAKPQHCNLTMTIVIITSGWLLCLWTYMPQEYQPQAKHADQA